MQFTCTTSFWPHPKINFPSFLLCPIQEISSSRVRGQQEVGITRGHMSRSLPAGEKVQYCGPGTSGRCSLMSRLLGIKGFTHMGEHSSSQVHILVPDSHMCPNKTHRVFAICSQPGLTSMMSSIRLVIWMSGQMMFFTHFPYGYCSLRDCNGK